MFNKITFYNHREDYNNQLFYRGVFYVSLYCVGIGVFVI